MKKRLLNKLKKHYDSDSVEFYKEGGTSYIYLLTSPEKRIIKCSKKPDNKFNHLIYREFFLLKQFANNFIPKVYSFGSVGFDQGEFNFFEMEFIEGDTIDYSNRYTSEEISNIIFQTSALVHILHQNDFVLNDLKPENLLFNRKEQEMKLIDFGLAEGIEEKKTVKGTLSFMAPEKLNGFSSFKESDVFSIGAVWYYLYSGKYLINSLNELENYSFLIEKKIDSIQLSPKIKEFLKTLVSQNIANRPDTSKILTFFKINLNYNSDSFIKQHFSFNSNEPVPDEIINILNKKYQSKKAQNLVIITSNLEDVKSAVLNYISRKFNFSKKILHIDLHNFKENPEKFYTVLHSCFPNPANENTKQKFFELINNNSIELELIVSNLRKSDPIYKEIIELKNTEKINFLVISSDTSFKLDFMEFNITTYRGLNKTELLQWFEKLFKNEIFPSELISRIIDNTDGNIKRISSILQSAVEQDIISFSEGKLIIDKSGFAHLFSDFDTKTEVLSDKDKEIAALFLYIDEPIDVILIQQITEYEVETLLKVLNRFHNIGLGQFYNDLFTFINPPKDMKQKFIRNYLKRELIKKFADTAKKLFQYSDKVIESYIYLEEYSEAEKIILDSAQKFLKNNLWSFALKYYLQEIELIFPNSETDSVFRFSIFKKAGYCFKQINDFKNSEKYYKFALNEVISSSTEYAAEILIDLGALYHSHQEYAQSIEFYKRAEKISEGSKNQKILMKIYNNTAAAYSDMKKLDEAESYFLKTRDLAEYLNNSFFTAVTSLNLGEISEKKYNFQKAKKYYLQTLKISQEKSKMQFVFLSKFFIGKIDTVHLNVSEAGKELEECSTFFKKTSQKEFYAETLIHLAAYYFYENDYDKSFNLIQESEEYLSFFNNQVLKLYAFLSTEIYLHKKDFYQLILRLNTLIKFRKENDFLKIIYYGCSNNSENLQTLYYKFQSSSDYFSVKYTLLWLYRISEKENHFEEIQRILQKFPDNLFKKIIESVIQKKIPENDISSDFLNVLNLILQINSSAAPEQLYKSILENIIEVSQMERGFFYLMENNRLNFYEGVDNLGNKISEKPISQTVINKALITGEPLFLENLPEETDFSNSKSIVNLSLKQAIAIPLELNNQIAGFIYCDSKKEKEINLTDSKLKLIKAIAVQGANAIRKMKTYEKIVNENETLHQRLQSGYIDKETIIGRNPKFIEILNKSKTIASQDITVLIEGETGTGKELIAQTIYENSLRRDKPFIIVNCAAVPGSLLESEFFGHEKGAFTGAHKQKKGKFELADKGTIFLDEIGEMPLELQAKLLRVIQNRTITRIGGSNEIEIDVRIIAATNKVLKELAETKKFRQDLYYRLNIVKLILPPLRIRKQDIPLLSYHFIQKFNKKFNKNIKGLSKELLSMFMQYHWPGNVRELENMIEQMMVFALDSLLTPELLPDDFAIDKEKSEELQILDFSVDDDLPVDYEEFKDYKSQILKEINYRYAKHITDITDNNINAASKMAKVTRAQIYNMLKKK